MERTAYRSERIAYSVLSIMGVLVILTSLSYGLGTLRKPGPGVYPFCIGLLILPLSLYLLIVSLRSATKGPTLSREGIKTLLSFMGACIFWILAMPVLGYVIVTLVTAFILGKIMKLEGWLKPLFLSVGLAIFVYLLFDLWLYIDLPRGILG
jgi:putative tricarboxylic transport membrane protein